MIEESLNKMIADLKAMQQQYNTLISDNDIRKALVLKVLDALIGFLELQVKFLY